MKPLLLLVFLLFAGIKSYASQLVIGLSSKSLIAWNIWEYKHGELKQHLLLFNQGEKEINVEIKEKRFSDNGNTFSEITTDSTFYKLDLAPGKLMKLAYPQVKGSMVYMEFLENQEDIGLMEINLAHPPAAFVQKKFGYYSNESINSGELGYWVKLSSIYDPKAKISFGLDEQGRKYEVSQLIKVLKPGEEISRDKEELSALKDTDESILEVSKGKKEAAFKLNETTGNQPFIPVSLFANHLSNGRLLMSAFNRIGIFQAN